MDTMDEMLSNLYKKFKEEWSIKTPAEIREKISIGVYGIPGFCYDIGREKIMFLVDKLVEDLNKSENRVLELENEKRYREKLADEWRE
jgi:ubiquitin C-terminal hydrolase